MSTVLYPGSFDPIHLGHLDIIEHSAELFGDVVVAVMHNDGKVAGLFTVDERVRLVNELGRRAPYYFLDADSVGAAVVVANVGLLAAGFLALGYLLSAMGRAAVRALVGPTPL